MFATIDTAARKTERSNLRITDLNRRADIVATSAGLRTDLNSIVKKDIAFNFGAYDDIDLSVAEPRIQATSKVFITRKYATHTSMSPSNGYVITPGVGFTITPIGRTTKPFYAVFSIVIFI